jgi:hypothetical protein
MATRYWVGGAGNWSSTTKWSTTSGGTSGASVPTDTDDVVFDANSGGKFIATVDTARTCASLTITPSAAVGVFQLAITASLTVTGNFTTSGTAGNNRIWIRGTTYGVRTNLVCNGTVSISDCDFRDIIVTGTSAPISGTRIGNRGACTGITFDAPKTVYWNLAGAQNWSANAWATTSTGTPSLDNFPLPQDTATFTNAGSVTGTITLDSALQFTGTVDMSGRTSAMTLATGATTVYGNWTNGSGVTIISSNVLTFSGEGTKIITSAGRAFAGGITVDIYGGSVELADAVSVSSQNLTVTNGTFDTKGYAVTAGSLSSSNSNVRAIKLGSSTLTFSGGGALTFTTNTNLIFNAGTSSITVNNNFPVIDGGSIGGLTFYNVTTASNSLLSIKGINTFNNLTITPQASAGLATLGLNANQTINGTLTVAGASAIRRIFVRSTDSANNAIVGTTRTLTVNSLSANDCDFRDITIAGSAAGASPTRAGDCGGNSGITFPSPKTVYWNLSGSQTFSATAWATSSGGTPDVNNFPLAQDTAIFDNAGSIGTANSGNGISWNFGTIDSSSRTSAATLNFNGTVNIHGDFKNGTGITYSNSSAIGLTFANRGTQTITSNGVAFNNGITIDSATGIVQLADALTLSPVSSAITLTSGTFDAVTYNVTTGLFSSNNTNVRTLKMGSGLWTITGTGNFWNTSSSLILFKNTADILLSDISTTARTFNGGGLSYNKLTIGGATGTSTLTILGNNQFTELASTKTVAHTIALGTTTQTFGAWTVTGSAGNVVTLTGTGTSHVLAGSCTSGIDYLAMGSIGFAATSPAEFYAGANSTGTAAAPVYRTAKPADSTRYWVGGTGNWSDTARWSTGSGGASGASVPRSHDDVVFDTLSNLTAYTATVNAVTGGIRCKALTISPPATGNITLAGSQQLSVHGNVTFPATGMTRTYSGTLTLSGSTTGKTLTTNGVALTGFTVNGVGCEWTLGSASNNGNDTLTVTNGSFATGNYNLTTGSISSNNANSRTISLGSSSITISTDITFTNGTNLTFNAGTSTITATSNLVNVTGSGQTFYNYVRTNTSAGGGLNITGSNTFNNITIAGTTTAGLRNVTISADQTINGTLTISAGTNATMRTFVQSNTLGTTRTLTCNAVASLTDIDFRDITIAGSAAPVSGTRLGDCKGNSGINFDAAKTVYFAAGGGTNWGSTNAGGAWSLTNNGTSDHVAFPLAQDTAVFPSSPTPYPSSGQTVTINGGYNIGTIDMSARTSNTMLLSTSLTPTIYGNWINGTGTTLNGTNTLNFSGRGSQTITSAGRTFTNGININSPSGSVTLQDAFSSSVNTSNGLILSFGTFNADIYNVTFIGASTQLNFSSTSNPRTVAVGSGTWVIPSENAGAWNAGTPTNLTVTGTGTISLTGATAKTFAGGGMSYSGITLNQGGVGALTITGNNTFANITDTVVGATTIALGTTTQRVGAFEATGTAGNVLTITGNTSNLIYTGSGNVTDIDYLNLQGRAYGANGELVDIWYAGNNSVNSGSLGWLFEAGVTPPPSANSNFFLMFG